MLLRKLSLSVALLVVTGCGDGTPDNSAGDNAGITGGDFHSLVADPMTNGRLYVGGHERVARSDDGGHTWTAVTSLHGADAMGWALASDAIWVSGHPGVIVSFDGGTTFESRTTGLPDSDVHAFGGTNGRVFAAGPGIGVAMSTDSGASWTTVTSDAGQAFFGRILLDPANPDHLIAADVQIGVVSSTDGGQTWTALGSQPASWVSSGDSLTTLYASGGAMPQRSVDGGTTWDSFSVPAGATLVEAGTDGVLYAGVHEGNAVTVWVSTDNGETWARA